MKRWIVAGALALAGCGGDEPTTPASVVPAGASVYASFDAGARALAMPAALTGTPPQELRPWVGDRAALFTLSDVPDRAALVFAVADEDGARAFAREVAADGRFVTAMVDGHLVVAESEQLVAAARAAAEDDSALDAAAEEGTAAYVSSNDTRTLGGLLPRLGVDRYAEKLVVGAVPADARVTARLWERRGATVLEVEGAGERHPPGSPIADLPGNTWFAVADGDLGALAASAATVETVAFGQIESELGVDLDNDVLPHVGAGSAFAHDMSPGEPTARLAAELDDEASVRRAAIGMIREQRQRSPGRVPYGHVSGPSSEDPWLDAHIKLAPLNLADNPLFQELALQVENGRLTADFGTTGGSTDKLAETRWYRAAERHLGAPPRLFVDLATLQRELPQADRLGGGVLAASESERGGRRVQRFVLLTR